MPVSSWQDTRDTLHLYTQVVGKVRLALSPWLNHGWQVPLYVTARGLGTTPMPTRRDGHDVFELEFDFIAQAMSGMALSPLVLGWTIASLLRLSVGSATVAVVTAAGIMAPIAAAVPGMNRELLVVAIGAGSLIAGHVNDGGYWLVKGYLNTSVPQTLATWTVLETIVAVCGLAGTLALAAVVG